jgi:hypothetical protein
MVPMGAIVGRPSELAIFQDKGDHAQYTVRVWKQA